MVELYLLLFFYEMPTENFFQRINYPWLILFATAMGFLEAIVVVYVRELYYPNGFIFPLKILPPTIVLIELVREACTLVMLLSVAALIVKPYLRRLAVFLFLFGVWDIVYYVGLKLFLNWPESFLTWDILFLIPITWVGPVLAPVVCSVVMIVMAVFIDFNFRRYRLKVVKWNEWLLIYSGALVILYTFMFDFGKLIIDGHFLSGFLALPKNPEFLLIMTSYVPTHYKWGWFFIGIGLIVIGNLLAFRRIRK